jgi:oligopeptide/dipeptide ABC transporter ATP-binding protein
MYAGKIVEIGPVRQMIEAPKHPYTKLLVESLPGIEVKQALVGIPGLPPPLVNLPPGCSLQPALSVRLRAVPAETPELQAGGAWPVRGLPPLSDAHGIAAAAGATHAGGHA